MAAAKAKGAAKWIPPLPHGWEARYDDDSSAYFFIDHVHKQTQWEDPRFSKPAPKAHPPGQAASAVAASSLGFGGNPLQTSDAIALKDLSTHQRPKDQSQNSRSNINEAKLTTDVDAAVVNKLKAEFPKATKELITDMLALCHNSERETREQLNDLGFLTNNTKGKSSNHASPHHTTGSGPQAPKKAQDTHPQASATTAAKKEMSESDKKRSLIQAKGLFPKLDSDVIRIALNQCHYDLEEVKPLLTAWMARNESSDAFGDASTKSGSTGVSTSVSSVHSFSPPVGSLEPVGLDEGAGHKPKTLASSQPSTYPSGHSASPKRSTGIANTSQLLIQGAKGDAASSKSATCSQHARAKQVTKPKQPTSQPAVVTSQPAVEPKSKATSQYRTQANGPDVSLRKGPDSTLLTSDYTQANGPDKSIRVGPDSSRLSGPQKAVGPDLSLRCGPQSALLHENRNNNLPTTIDMLAK